MAVSAFSLTLGTGAEIIFLACLDGSGIIPADGYRQWIDLGGCDGVSPPEPHVFELSVLVVLMEEEVLGLIELCSDGLVIIDDPEIFSRPEDPEETIDMASIPGELSQAVRPDIQDCIRVRIECSTPVLWRKYVSSDR